MSALPATLAALTPERLDAAMGEAAPARVYADALAHTDQLLHEELTGGLSAADVVGQRALAMDQLLRHAWGRVFGVDRANGVALVAVGGYGRRELLPRSDVDLLILVAGDWDQHPRAPLEEFVTLLWDAGLKLGHSVRTVDQCVVDAEGDVTFATNLMESRLLDGDRTLFDELVNATGPDRLWPAANFFQAKLDEQVSRHARYDNTAYRLEPNIKEGPGGLRDIQMVSWVARRHFDARTLAELVDHGFLTADEHARLTEGQNLLWRIRWHLHRLTGRGEDRLLFDHQHELAVAFGDADGAGGPNRAVERFMQRYYRTVMELQRLNEILLQFFREAILEPVEGQPVRRLNARFRVRGDTLEVARPDTFRRRPRALLEMFLLLAHHPEISGIRAETLRRVRDDLTVIDASVRADPCARSIFLELLRQPQRVTSQLVRMNRHGVLGAWLPAFDRIVGRMQYDLFHSYTVDEHTLRVIRNLRRFRIGVDRDEFAHCSELMAAIDEPELLYIAALFHDIAKGRDGDHSELGAREAEAFCRDHALNSVQTGLVAWLIQNHLLMSITAQRRDLSDPAVIHEFAAQVSSIEHLDRLYLLTVADIRATNPSLWNSWKENLLRELYQKTAQALRRGLDNPIDKHERIAEVQKHARALLAEAGMAESEIITVWSDLGDMYFLRHNADEIAWHTRALSEHPGKVEPLIRLRRETQRGSTEIFIASTDHRHRFTLVTSVLDRLGLSVVDARILTARSGRAIDTFLVLEASGDPITDDYRVREIRSALESALAYPERTPVAPNRRTPRRMRHFDIPLRVEAERQPGSNLTAIEVTAADHPGLLSRIAQAMLNAGVRVHNARIATVGERVDDVFFVTDAHNQALDEDLIESVHREIARHLEK